MKRKYITNYYDNRTIHYPTDRYMDTIEYKAKVEHIISYISRHGQIKLDDAYKKPSLAKRVIYDNLISKNSCVYYTITSHNTYFFSMLLICIDDYIGEYLIFHVTPKNIYSTVLVPELHSRYIDILEAILNRLSTPEN